MMVLRTVWLDKDCFKGTAAMSFGHIVQVYGASKLYNIMVAKAWNEKLKGTGVEAFSAHPGLEAPPKGQI